MATGTSVSLKDILDTLGFAGQTAQGQLKSDWDTISANHSDGSAWSTNDMLTIQNDLAAQGYMVGATAAVVKAVADLLQSVVQKI